MFVRNVLLPAIVFGFPLLPVTCSATSLSLTFQELTPPDQILDYYSGGFTAHNQGPGPNYGITFSPNATVVGSGLVDPNSLLIAAGTTIFLNIPNGLDPVFSFYYTSAVGGLLQAWDGPSATGRVLDSFAMHPAGIPNPAAVMNLPGTRSFSIDAGPSDMRADYLSFAQGGVVPEPSMAAVTAVVLLGVVILKKQAWRTDAGIGIKRHSNCFAVRAVQVPGKAVSVM